MFACPFPIVRAWRAAEAEKFGFGLLGLFFRLIDSLRNLGQGDIKSVSAIATRSVDLVWSRRALAQKRIDRVLPALLGAATHAVQAIRVFDLNSVRQMDSFAREIVCHATHCITNDHAKIPPVNERQYLAHYSQITADNVTATIESRNDDDTFMVREIGSRALVRASKANPSDEFKTGARVIITRPSASRSVLGTSAVILSRAPRDQKGLSETTPAESRAFTENSMIISIDPDPLVLVAGGDAAEQTIIGRGFAAAATYSAPGDLADPIVTDAVAPSVTPTTIVMNISADADSPLGMFVAEIGTLKARNALKIIAAPPPPPSYYVVTGEITVDPELYPDSTFKTVLWILDSLTLELVHQVEILEERSWSVFAIGGVIYWLTGTGFFGSSDNVVTLRTFTIATSASENLATDYPVSIRMQYAQSLYVDGKILIGTSGSTSGGLWSLDLDGTGATKEWTEITAGSSGRTGMCVTDDAIFLAGPSKGTVRLDRATFAQEATNATPTGHRIIAPRSWAAGVYGAFTGDLCLCGLTLTSVRWLDAADLSVMATFAVGGGSFSGPVQIDDSIYFYNSTSGLLHRADLDGGVVDDVATITGILVNNATTQLPVGSMNTDGVAIYMLSAAFEARRYAVDGTLLATSPVLGAETPDPTDEVDLLQTLYVAG